MRIEEADAKIEALIKRIEDTKASIETAEKRLEEVQSDIINNMAAGADEDLRSLRQERQDQQQLVADLKALIKHLEYDLEDAREEKIEAEKEAAKDEYNVMAQERTKVIKAIEKHLDTVCENLEKLMQIDNEQRMLAKRADIVTGRSTTNTVNDYLVYKLKPFIHVTPAPYTKQELHELDILSREV